MAADEAYRTAEMRRKVPTGRVNREARDDPKVIRAVLGRFQRGKKKPMHPPV